MRRAKAHSIANEVVLIETALRLLKDSIRYFDRAAGMARATGHIEHRALLTDLADELNRVLLERARVETLVTELHAELAALRSKQDE